MPTFQLQTTDGEQLGQVELGRPDWPPGSVIYRGDGPNLRVVEVRDGGRDGADVLVVEEVGGRAVS
jgi:hypothetical protein